jgi:aromatic ring-cleaving dioxygenase
MSDMRLRKEEDDSDHQYDMVWYGMSIELPNAIQ